MESQEQLDKIYHALTAHPMVKMVLKHENRATGLADYAPVFEAMKAFNDTRNEATEDELWVVEHPPALPKACRKTRAPAHPR